MAAKLLDDCFEHDRARLTHDEAVALLRARVKPTAVIESVPLMAANGRILAAPVAATHAVPPRANSAVDGYAFAASAYDPTAGATFMVAGRAAAGAAMTGIPRPGTAVRIFTGALVPDGLDTVAMEEDCVAAAGDGGVTVRVPGGLKPGANVRQAGEDVAAGEPLFAVGHVIRPQDLAALASIGAAELACFKRLRIGVVSTGDELVRAHAATTLLPGQVYDANAPMLLALAGLAACEVEDLGIWPDGAGEVRRRLAAAAGAFDAVITTGGASRGEEDHVATALAVLGRRHLWQIAIKPGRPMMFGQIGDTVVLGLPGNPVAVFVCFLMYAFPLLRALSGAPWPEPRCWRLPAAFAFPRRKTGRREFWRGMLEDTARGLTVDKFARDGSGLISGLRVADGLINVGEDVTAIRPGDLVDFIPFSEFGIVGR